MNKLDKIVAELQSDKYVCIDVFDLTHQKPYARKVFGAQILANHQSILDYFKAMNHRDGIKEIQITPHRKSGNSYKHNQPAFDVMLVNEKKEDTPPNVETLAPPITSPAVPVQAPPPFYQTPPINQYQNMGLGAPEIANLLAVKDKLTDLKERYLDVKQEKRDLQSKLNTALENLNAKTIELGIADGKLQNAVELAKMQTKSFWDTKGAEKLLDGASNLATFAQAQAQGEAPMSGMQQPAVEVSEIKKILLESVAHEAVADAMAQELQMVLNGLYNVPEFTTELRTLITKYQLHE